MGAGGCIGGVYCRGRGFGEKLDPINLAVKRAFIRHLIVLSTWIGNAFDTPFELPGRNLRRSIGTYWTFLKKIVS